MSGNLYQFIDVKQKIKDNTILILMHPRIFWMPARHCSHCWGLAVNRAKFSLLWSLYSSGGEKLETIIKQVNIRYGRGWRVLQRKINQGKGMVVVVRSQLFYIGLSTRIPKEKVAFEHRTEGSEGAIYVPLWPKSVQAEERESAKSGMKEHAWYV